MKTVVNKSVLIIVFFLLNVTICLGQVKKDDLYSKREKIRKEIQFTSKLLQSTSQKKGSTIQDLNLLKKKILNRRLIIDNYNNEIVKLNRNISDRQENVQKLESELEIQKQLYADFIRYSYKNYNHYTKAVYLLASKNLNQFYLRKKYLEQLESARREKILLITKLQTKISDEVDQLVKEKENKELAIQNIRSEKTKLDGEKKDRERIVKKLADEETKLREEIKRKENIEKEIAHKLEELIREEAKKSKYTKITPEQQLVSNRFALNKGKLPWPTRQGVITEKYGEHNHPVIKGVKVRNNGIDISTLEGEKVRCLFEGEVRRIFSIKGGSYGIIVKHGEYYTVYYNINNIKVNVGDKITTKETIGEVSKSVRSKNPIVHLEIWKGMQKLDPEMWISN